MEMKSFHSMKRKVKIKSEVRHSMKTYALNK